MIPFPRRSASCGSPPGGEIRTNSARSSAGPRHSRSSLRAASAARLRSRYSLYLCTCYSTQSQMDLFSALGEAKRQLQIRENMLMTKDREILDLKGNIAEMLVRTRSHQDDGTSCKGLQSRFSILYQFL